MKQTLLLIMLFFSGPHLYSQQDSLLKFIFVPHPRSEDRVNESVHPGIAKIDFTKYDITMLGGDLTWSAAKDSATLAYCDKLFNLGSPNTLWTLGNHDVQTKHRALIKKFTKRESYYCYSMNGVTFIVLDTELNANSFQSSFIIGPQLEMVKEVCDTIKESKYLIVLHHRLLWMINSEFFKDRLTDSIAASSRDMDTTNFYSDLYPLLRKVKSKGIKVILLGGDKTKINIDYSPEDSITFYAARLAPDFTDDENNVIVLSYNLRNKEMICSFVPVADAITSVEQNTMRHPDKFMLYQNFPNPFNPETVISFNLPTQTFVSLKVFDITGREIVSLISEELSEGFHTTIWNAENMTSGIYLLQMQANGFIQTRKIILLK